jgi:hypothetical protein
MPDNDEELTMTDTCGPMLQMPFAYYDPDTCSVRTSQATFPWDSTPSSPTLPPWGSMCGGELFERPTPAPLTAGRDYSSSQLLPTSRATDGDKGGPNQVNGRGVRDSLPGVAPTLLPTPLAQMNGPSQRELDEGNPYRRPETEVHLLPTPVADHSRGLPQPGTDYQSLPNVAVSLLPTPSAMDGAGAMTPDARMASGEGYGPALRDIRYLLPTPTAHQHPAAETRDPHQRIASSHQTELSDVARAGFPTSAPTLPPSPDGNASSDDQPPPPPNQGALDLGWTPRSWSG